MSDETRPHTIVGLSGGERWRLTEPYGAVFEAKANAEPEAMIEVTSFEEDAPPAAVAVKASSIEVIYEITQGRWEADQKAADDRQRLESEMRARGALG